MPMTGDANPKVAKKSKRKSKKPSKKKSPPKKAASKKSPPPKKREPVKKTRKKRKVRRGKGLRGYTSIYFDNVDDVVRCLKEGKYKGKYRLF